MLRDETDINLATRKTVKKLISQNVWIFLRTKQSKIFVGGFYFFILSFCDSGSVRRKCLKGRLAPVSRLPADLLAAEKPLMWDVWLKSDIANHDFISSEKRKDGH